MEMNTKTEPDIQETLTTRAATIANLIGSVEGVIGMIHNQLHGPMPSVAGDRDDTVVGVTNQLDASIGRLQDINKALTEIEQSI